MTTERTSRPQRTRVAAPLRRRLEPGHVAMRAVGEEASSRAFASGMASGRVMPMASKPCDARARLSARLERGGIGQKSRSA